MEHTQDVERLFSWLKAPMVHYREFAPQIEVAEAVATWPVAHRTAVQTGLASDSDPAPHGDTAARERQARDRRFMPATAARVIHDNPMPGTEPPPPTLGRLTDVPAAEAAAGGSERRPPGGRGEEITRPEPAQPSAEPNQPTMAGFDEPAPAVRPGISRPAPTRPAASGDGRGLFGGEYREREPDLRPADRPAERQDRSLDAVFSRLSGRGDRLPDPRERARTTPGLGPVFGRLR